MQRTIEYIRQLTSQRDAFWDVDTIMRSNINSTYADGELSSIEPPQRHEEGPMLLSQAANLPTVEECYNEAPMLPSGPPDQAPGAARPSQDSLWTDPLAPRLFPGAAGPQPPPSARSSADESSLAACSGYGLGNRSSDLPHSSLTSVSSNSPLQRLRLLQPRVGHDMGRSAALTQSTTAGAIRSGPSLVTLEGQATTDDYLTDLEVHPGALSDPKRYQRQIELGSKPPGSKGKRKRQ